jgi:PAS domain S-box-containing protein
MSDADEQFRVAMEAAPTGMLMIDRKGNITLVNAQIERLFGYSRAELIGASMDRLVPARYRLRHPGYRDDFFLAPQTRAMGMGRELFGLRKDGSEVPVEIGLTPVSTPEGEFVLSSIVDITERKRSEELFRLALEAAPTGMLMIDDRGAITLVNAQIEVLFGYPREELIGKPVEQLIPARFRERHPSFRGSFFAAPQTRVMGAGRDLYGLRKDGTEVPIEIGLNPLETSAGRFVLSSIVDITERRRAVDQLHAGLKERDVLLQEVHHRVKNNLQLICSLINVQARKLEEGGPREVLAECKHRVEAIAMIHEQLYQSRNYASIPFSEYARSLASNIVHAAAASGTIELHCQCDPVLLPVDKAISCGLILNELITNALKHAFPEGNGGRLFVELQQLPDSRVRLSVRDTGIGMAFRFEDASMASLGTQLVKTLTDQLDGSLQMQIDGGTVISIEFPVAA